MIGPWKADVRFLKCHLTRGWRSLLLRFDLIQEKHKIRPLNQIRQAENEFVEKMWYNRKPVDIDAQSWEPDVKKSVKRSIREMEKKYGKKNLIVDDFGWGMMNGKLSALRLGSGRGLGHAR